MERERSENAVISRRTFFKSLGVSLLGLGGFGFADAMYECIQINKHRDKLYPPVPQEELDVARETVAAFENKTYQLIKEGKKAEMQSLIQSTNFDELQRAYKQYREVPEKHAVLGAQLRKDKNIYNNLILNTLTAGFGFITLIFSSSISKKNTQTDLRKEIE